MTEQRMQTDLVERAMHGDHDAFAQLATTAWTRLYGTAGLILGDEGSTHDAVQATLIRAWRDLPTLRDPKRFDAWLHRILVNACRDEARRRRRGAGRELRLDAVATGAVADSAAGLADREELDVAFERLTVDERTIVTLVYYRDLSLAQAAASLGVPVGTAKSRLHRALRSLRAALAAERRLSVEGEART